MTLPHDPLWPRANSLFMHNDSEVVDVTLIGIPASRTSLSPTSADQTPNAIREELARYSTFHSNVKVDIDKLSLADSGDIPSPDLDESQTIKAFEVIAKKSKLTISLGGDNSITFSSVLGSKASGLITLDAHHDLRDGVSNGSPVRRLIEAGLSGQKVVQIGIADFSNSPAYAKRARDLGITVIPRSELRHRSATDIWAQALEIAGSNVFVDFDMDVCDRTFVPACPASAPGGISADEIRQFAFLAGSSESVVGIDITEIDSTKDASDKRTIRLAALVILEAIAGFSTRR